MISLNIRQTTAAKLISTFLDKKVKLPEKDECDDLFAALSEPDYTNKEKPDPSLYNYLLLGPGGTGKTTTIVSAFASKGLSIAFCAFTNKATQVLRGVNTKVKDSFEADFMTIHKLYQLKPYKDYQGKLQFKFNLDKLDKLAKYDVIIFDECSCISTELIKYIYEAWAHLYFAHGKCIKHLFLGDFWQMPPVCEKASLIFTKAIKEKWCVSKLDIIMRSKNQTIAGVNNHMLECVKKFKKPKSNKQFVSDFCKKFPNNMIKGADRIYGSESFYKTYLTEWKRNPSIVMITFSRSNCDKVNAAIQHKLNTKARRKIVNNDVKFYPGDRCCVDRPVDLFTFENNKDQYSYGSYIGCAYNGDIYDVVDTKDIVFYGPYQILDKLNKGFPGQILTVSLAGSKKQFDILYIDKKILDNADKIAKKSVSRKEYMLKYSCLVDNYPRISRGYCITVYKSQGSEWDTVLVNTNSIKWSIVSDGSQDVSLKKKKLLFKALYTAASRASEKLYIM